MLMSEVLKPKYRLTIVDKAEHKLSESYAKDVTP